MLGTNSDCFFLLENHSVDLKCFLRIVFGLVVIVVWVEVIFWKKLFTIFKKIIYLILKKMMLNAGLLLFFT